MDFRFRLFHLAIGCAAKASSVKMTCRPIRLYISAFAGPDARLSLAVGGASLQGTMSIPLLLRLYLT
jgi:hypothetical protein